MGVNAVYIMGMVAARPVRDVTHERCALLVVTAELQGDTRARHRVIAEDGLVDVAATLVVGQSVYVTGRLQRDDSHRVIVVARDLWPLADAPEPPSDAAPTGTHASPREHQRTGHWRRVGIGTRRERLVWVRATTVSDGRGDRDPGSPLPLRGEHGA
jgi:hypothetical protein